MTAEPGVATGRDEMLAVEGVSVRLGGREVLHDVRFTVRPGEFVGLIGSNGAGKTTLLRVIIGLQKPAAGEVRIGDAAADKAEHGPSATSRRRSSWTRICRCGPGTWSGWGSTGTASASRCRPGAGVR